VQADTEPPLLTARNGTRRPHGMIEMFDPGGYVLEKMLPGFRQPDAAMAPLE
jgi:hypothetical protein